MTTNITVIQRVTNVTPPTTRLTTIKVSGEKGPQGATGIQGVRGESIVPYSYSGPLSVQTGRSRYRFPFAATINGISAIIDTQPEGSAILIDVNLDGISLFSLPGDRLSIASNTNVAAEIVPTRTTAITSGQYLTVDVDQIGSAVAGSNLTVFVRYTPA